MLGPMFIPGPVDPLFLSSAPMQSPEQTDEIARIALLHGEAGWRHGSKLFFALALFWWPGIFFLKAKLEDGTVYDHRGPLS